MATAERTTARTVHLGGRSRRGRGRRVFAVLFFLGTAMLDIPHGLGDEETAAWWADSGNQTTAVVSMYCFAVRGALLSRILVQTAIAPAPSAYGPRHAAYDLKKLRGKQIVRRIGSTRRYQPIPSGLRAITALLVLRDKAIKPLLAAAQEISPSHAGQNPRAIDRHYHDLRCAMQGVFQEIGLAA